MGEAASWPRTALWWTAACGVAGFAVGRMLGVPVRQQVFLAVLAAGAWGLAVVWRAAGRSQAHVSASDKGTSEPAAERRNLDAVGQGAGHEAQSQRLTDGEVLSPEAARDWLDQFLRRQQG